jgi:hypothetical protein
MRLPTTLEVGTTQERIACPSTLTVQAPQAATPQPNLVPVMFSTSRSNHSRGMAGSATASTALPLMINVIEVSTAGLQNNHYKVHYTEQS